MNSDANTQESHASLYIAICKYHIAVHVVASVLVATIAHDSVVRAATHEANVQ